MKIAIFVDGAMPSRRDAAREIREAVCAALPEAKAADVSELEDGRAELAIVSAVFPFDVERLVAGVEAIERDVPLVWLYPDAAEDALGDRPVARFRVGSGGSGEPTRAFLAASVARLAFAGAESG